MAASKFISDLYRSAFYIEINPIHSSGFTQDSMPKWIVLFHNSPSVLKLMRYCCKLLESCPQGIQRRCLRDSYGLNGDLALSIMLHFAWTSAFGAQWSSSISKGAACKSRINSPEQVDVITIFTAVFRFSMDPFFNQCSNSPGAIYNLKKTCFIWISSDYLRIVMRLRRDNVFTILVF